ncbi:hypothetical protein [Bacillus sonorensis]|uniref:Uncharacterized protein n=1 Tax=Bacillus sonorensis TaxID=119858 RepID=A0ABN5ACC1_9BACI|nr:hypothetical protein [Bacillus sonorensis]ASB88422.1 hypothetical protein S101395_01914 [Bacillus sonorensis]RHJ05900.1 hypothetical protein DW143_21380 [Bacillus sonorensis]GIN67667.1 hypothetical protein J41TS2_30880 [Bacillus sonorensis]
MENHVLVGNGINIQFGGEEYLNRSIIDRAIKNIEEGDFPKEIYPYETKEYFEKLYKLSPKVIKGKLNHHAFTDKEKKELSDFISRYRFHKGKLRYYHIGFEDYFLLHQIFCRHYQITNPDKFNFQEVLKCFFLDSIYNKGKINTLFELYPEGLKSWFKQFDEIFTTNYDKNIELLTNMKVNYIHGAFHIKKDIYDENSFRNKLSDNPMKNYKIIEGYDHLYSTALSTYSGFLKEFSGTMHEKANNTIDKFVKAIDEDPNKLDEITHFKNSDNQLLKNMYESIILKLNDRSLKFQDYYPFDKLKNCSGTLTILGLSPNNDSHLLDMIFNNKGITKIIYYYFAETEGQAIVNYLSNKEVELKNVNVFWRAF